MLFELSIELKLQIKGIKGAMITENTTFSLILIRKRREQVPEILDFLLHAPFIRSYGAGQECILRRRFL